MTNWKNILTAITTTSLVLTSPIMAIAQTPPEWAPEDYELPQNNALYNPYGAYSKVTVYTFTGNNGYTFNRNNPLTVKVYVYKYTGQYGQTGNSIRGIILKNKQGKTVGNFQRFHMMNGHEQAEIEAQNTSNIYASAWENLDQPTPFSYDGFIPKVWLTLIDLDAHRMESPDVGQIDLTIGKWQQVIRLDLQSTHEEEIFLRDSPF
ncbi:hypothetical protein [Moorena sp. SIO3H5]|uniref:hypothetical protein n=1 Tax=Moorena sp. SIO3H5 TaxID=2607834 RepID=UPI0013BA6F7C|nr:hypothetical protein [Moorena sp. SIO3H5]NEO71136.1 hypothetical protein [Moorena sp. SIO3H5]